MLTISTGGFSRDCEGVTRRDMLKIGALGLGGLTLPGLLQMKAQAAESGSFLRNKSVVFLFLYGGPSQFETFDPKMDAPDNIRTYFGETQSRLPGVTLGTHFPQMGAMADKLAFVRSFRVGSGNHRTGRNLVISGNNPTQAPMGGLYTVLAGNSNERTGMPNNILVPPRAMGAEYSRLNNSIQEILATGSLSPEHRPFVPSAPVAANNNNNRNRNRNRNPAPSGGLLTDMELRIPQDRLNDRRALLNQLSNLQHGLDRSGNVEQLNRYQQQAFNVITRGVSQAFDLSNERPETVARYDTTTRFRIPERVLRKQSRNARRIPEFSPIALGKQMLLARRLCEAGCGFVTVTSYGWDMHGNAFGIDDGMPCLGPAVDHVVSTFLTDLEERGMSDDVLLVITGEMGRTPRKNNKRGRDHWANLTPLALAGGGLQMGQVIGQSDRQGNRPATNPYTVNNLLSTIMHTVFDMGQLRVARGLPSDVVRFLANNAPIRELVG